MGMELLSVINEHEYINKQEKNLNMKKILKI